MHSCDQLGPLWGLWSAEMLTCGEEGGLAKHRGPGFSAGTIFQQLCKGSVLAHQ